MKISIMTGRRKKIFIGTGSLPPSRRGNFSLRLEKERERERERGEREGEREGERKRERKRERELTLIAAGWREKICSAAGGERNV